MIELEASTLAAIIPPLLLVEGFFSGSEIALLSADRIALKQMGRASASGKLSARARGARLALKLASHPERVLSTTLLMTSICVIGISSLVSLHFAARGTAHSDLWAVLLTSPLVVLFGELVPKTVYQRRATHVAPWVALPLAWTYWAFYPITRLLQGYTTRLSRLVGPVEELLAGRRRTTREELRALLSYGKKETELKTVEKQMIRRILDFKDSEAKHALIPLVRVEAIEESATVQIALERFESHRHSRMPVYSGRVDNIVGVLEAGDLFAATDLQQSVRYFLTPAHYVAETQALEDVFVEMTREEHEMSVVVDEHGGAVGILTFEDIVEEIVGEIHDEYDSAALPYKELSESSWIVQARMEIDAINEKLKLDLPHGEYETLSGFLLQQFGRIPETRDELYFTTPEGTFKFTIRNATERHIEHVLVERVEEAAGS